MDQKPNLLIREIQTFQQLLVPVVDPHFYRTVQQLLVHDPHESGSTALQIWDLLYHKRPKDLSMLLVDLGDLEFCLTPNPKTSSQGGSQDPGTVNGWPTSSASC